jgi:hypothetical protein
MAALTGCNITIEASSALKTGSEIICYIYDFDQH